MSRGWDCDADGYDTLRDLGRLPGRVPALIGKTFRPIPMPDDLAAYSRACPTCGAPAHVECRGDGMCPQRGGRS